MPNLRVSRAASRPIASRAQIRARDLVVDRGHHRSGDRFRVSSGQAPSWVGQVAVMLGVMVSWAGAVCDGVAVTAPVSRPGVRLLCRVRQHWQGPGLSDTPISGIYLGYGGCGGSA